MLTSGSQVDPSGIFRVTVEEHEMKKITQVLFPEITVLGEGKPLQCNTDHNKNMNKNIFGSYLQINSKGQW